MITFNDKLQELQRTKKKKWRNDIPWALAAV